MNVESQLYFEQIKWSQPKIVIKSEICPSYLFWECASRCKAKACKAQIFNFLGANYYMLGEIVRFGTILPDIADNTRFFNSAVSSYIY